MSEYIIETFGFVPDICSLARRKNTPLYRAITDVLVSRQHESIVRCRDCTRKDYCSFIYEYDYRPSGFCAWGEKKGS